MGSVAKPIKEEGVWDRREEGGKAKKERKQRREGKGRRKLTGKKGAASRSLICGSLY